MAMQRWDPFVGLGSLERDIDRLWSRTLSPTAKDRRVQSGIFAPTTDVLTRGEDMVVRVELPGVMEKDIYITVTDDVLTITGRREEQSEMTDQGGYLARESFRGSFERSMSLPAGVEAEAIVAKYEDGVLEVVVPKAAAMHERRTRHIELQSGERRAMEEGH